MPLSGTPKKLLPQRHLPVLATLGPTGIYGAALYTPVCWIESDLYSCCSHGMAFCLLVVALLSSCSTNYEGKSWLPQANKSVTSHWKAKKCDVTLKGKKDLGECVLCEISCKFTICSQATKDDVFISRVETQQYCLPAKPWKLCVSRKKEGFFTQMVLLRAAAFSVSLLIHCSVGGPCFITASAAACLTQDTGRSDPQIAAPRHPTR